MQAQVDMYTSHDPRRKTRISKENESFDSKRRGRASKEGDTPVDDPADVVKEMESLVDLENEMRVEDWEFSSPHALSLEYLESQQSVVTVL